MSQNTTAGTVADPNDEAVIQEAVRELFETSPALRRQLTEAGFDGDRESCRQWLLYSLDELEAVAGHDADGDGGDDATGDEELPANTVAFSDVVTDKMITAAVADYLPSLMEELVRTYSVEEIQAQENVVIQQIVDFLEADINAFVDELFTEATGDHLQAERSVLAAED